MWLWSFQERFLWESAWKADHSLSPVLAAPQATHLDLSLLLRWCGRRRNCGFLLSNSRRNGCESRIVFWHGADRGGAALFLGQALLLRQAVGAGLGHEWQQEEEHQGQGLN